MLRQCHRATDNAISRSGATDTISGELPVSVIIPTFNRALVLQSTVGQFLKQTHHDYEIWIIDQSDTEDAASNARYIAETADRRLNYLHLDQKGPSNAR